MHWAAGEQSCPSAHSSQSAGRAEENQEPVRNGRGLLGKQNSNGAEFVPSGKQSEG